MRHLSWAGVLAVFFAPALALAGPGDDNQTPFQKKASLAIGSLIVPVTEWRIAPGLEVSELYQAAGGVELKRFPEDLIKELTAGTLTDRKTAVEYLSHLAVFVRGLAWEQNRDESESAFRLALGKYRPRIQLALEQILKTGDGEVRILAASALLSLSSEHTDAVGVIVREFQTNNASRQAKACELVGDAHLSHVSIIDALCACIDSPNAELRRAAAKATWEIGPRAAKCVPALIKVLESGDSACGDVEPFMAIALPTRRNIALLALSEMGESARTALSAISTMLDSADPLDVLDCLARLGPNARDALSDLRRALDKYKDYNRLLAAATILCIEPKDEKALKILLEAVASSDKRVRNQALNAGARMKPKVKAMMPAILAALKDIYSRSDVLDSSLSPRTTRYSNFECAIQLIAGLQELAEPAVPALTELAISGSREPNGDYDYSISADAAGALGSIGKAAIPALKSVVSDPKSEGAIYAVYALGRMGKDGVEAIPVLIKSLSHEEPMFRAVAAVALGKLKCVAAKKPLLKVKERPLDSKEDAEEGGIDRAMAAWALSQIDP